MWCLGQKYDKWGILIGAKSLFHLLIILGEKI